MKTMKVKKESIYQIIIGVLVLVQVVGIFLGVNYYFKSKDKPTYNPELATYLLNNHSSSSDILDTNKYELFVSGETHATQKNFDVEIDIIKNLSQNSDLKYIIAEYSMANAFLINTYLQTGEISNLDVVFKELKGTAASNNEFYKFLQDLYEFNKTLPNDKKLTYLGVDVEHQLNNTIGILYDIALRNDIYENIKELIENYNQQKSNDELLASLETIYTDIQNNSQMYSDKLGQEFWIFKYLIRNILNTYKYEIVSNDYLQQSSVRERAMIENFYEIYNHYPKGKYYGQWGLEHTYLSNVKINFHPENEPRLATALNSNEHSPVKDKVCSMTIVYFDSFNMNRDGREPQSIDIRISNDKNEMDSLKLFAQDNIQFFNLEAENSPFSKELYLLKDNLTKSGVTTDYFKNLIVVKNFPAWTIFNK